MVGWGRVGWVVGQGAKQGPPQAGPSQLLSSAARSRSPAIRRAPPALRAAASGPWVACGTLAPPWLAAAPTAGCLPAR